MQKKQLFPSPGLRFRFQNNQIYAQVSKSSGEFVVNLEVLLLLLNLNQKDVSSSLKKNISHILNHLPNEKECKNLILELKEANLISDFSEESESKIQDGFGDPWIQWAMISDKKRCDAYEKAFALTFEMIQNSVVADIGAGLGFLSYLAFKYGAKKIYAIEETTSHKKIIPILKKCGYPKNSGELKVIGTNSANALISENIQLIVSELFGNDPFEEGVLVTLYEFSQRKESGNAKYIPQKIEIFLDVIDLKEHAVLERVQKIMNCDENIFLNAAKKELDFTSLSFPLHFSPSNATRNQKSISLGEIKLDPPPKNISFLGSQKIIFQKTILPVFIAWYRVTLAPGITISSNPLEKDFCSHWSPIAIPLQSKIENNGEVEFKFSLNDDNTALKFTFVHKNKVVAAR